QEEIRMSTRRKGMSRRQFIGRTGAAVAAVTVVPAHVLGGRGRIGPNEKLDIAFIGVGGRGGANLGGLGGSNNVVAMCDVDQRRAGKAFDKHPKARKFRDFRKMLDQVDKQVDAVAVSTPDHTHAVAVIDAIRRGKHVYCEKPLAHSVWEVRAIMAAARKYKVVTQLGNQGHSSEAIRMFCEWIWDGAIGKVHTIHTGCSAVHCRIKDLPKLKEKHDVPEGLDWDLWLGPVQERPYHPMYLPGAWRAWAPFGTGTIGDWVCHVVDPVFWALDLGSPTTILTEAQTEWDPVKHADTFPAGWTVTFEFPAKGARPPVKMVFYNGKTPIPRPKELEDGRKVTRTGGVVYGEKGTIMYGSHGAGGVRIIPEEKMKAYGQHLPAKKIPRVGNHHADFVRAVRERRHAGSDFALYGGPLTELALLGIIGLRMPGRKLTWDARNMKFTDCPEANQYLKPEFRNGWTL
ncbi:MAG: Gfo/Idh/MocA family oxidoreductase, partial [Planctomycetota bacterium]|nr:Gfo/Idh/MocA family oxidoreductase [Planctomycetota bacterium]